MLRINDIDEGRERSDNGDDLPGATPLTATSESSTEPPAAAIDWADLAPWLGSGPLRVWVVGCGSQPRIVQFFQSTDHGPANPWNPQNRVFVSDFCQERLDAVRQALMPGGSSAWFVGPPGTPRSERGDVPHAVFASLVFGRHDLLDAPPFSRLDAIYCLQPPGAFCNTAGGRLFVEVAERIFERFHFALRSSGLLVLPEGCRPPNQDLFEPMPGLPGAYTRVHRRRRADPGPVSSIIADLIDRAAKRFDGGARSAKAKPSTRSLRRSDEEIRLTSAELGLFQDTFSATYETLQSKCEELQIAGQQLEDRNAELKAANDQLRRSVVLLERAHDDVTNLFRNTDQSMLVLDPELRIQYFNRPAAELFGIPADATGRRIEDCAWKFSDAGFAAACLAVSEALDCRRIEAATVDGRFMQLKISPYRSRDRIVGGVVVTGADVTELRSAGVREALLAAVLVDSPHAVVVFDVEGRIIAWNDGAERIYGYTAGEMLGKVVDEFLAATRVHSDPSDAAPIDTLMSEAHPDHGDRGLIGSDEEQAGGLIRNRRIAGFETAQMRRDGRRIVVSITATPVCDGAKGVVAYSMTIRDITLDRSLEQASLDAAASERRRIGRELHDGIGQELTGLAIQLCTLAEALSGEGHAEADLARRAYADARRTLGQVRALSRGLIPVETGNVNLPSALAELVDRLQVPRGCEVRFTGDRKARVKNRAIAAQLYRIAQEAVTNALKHARARLIEISLASAGGRIELKVRDDGVGIGSVRYGAGLGLTTMATRADLIHASLTIGKAGRRGTIVACTVEDK